jgi:hypothetical protein
MIDAIIITKERPHTQYARPNFIADIDQDLFFTEDNRLRPFNR